MKKEEILLKEGVRRTLMGRNVRIVEPCWPDFMVQNPVTGNCYIIVLRLGPGPLTKERNDAVVFFKRLGCIVEIVSEKGWELI
jgi:hypothetical protein